MEHRPAGDEPEYLRTAESLLRDHDLDISNNLSYTRFPGTRAEFEFSDAAGMYVERVSRDLPVHNIGLPVMILPAYALAGRLGSMLVVAIAMLLAVYNLGALALEMTGDDKSAALAALAAGVTVPCFFYSFELYPAAPSLALEVYVIRRLLGGGNRAAAGIALAALPWLHYRYVFFIPFVALLMFVVLRKRDAREYAAVFLPSLLSLSLLGVFQYSVFGGFVLFEVEHGRLGRQLTGLAGLLFDQEFGLLVYAPYYLLAPVGASLMRGRSRVALVFIALIFLFQYSQFALHASWWGDWSPTGRRHVEYVPLLVVPIAYALGRGGRLFRAVFAALFALSLAASLVTAAFPHQLLINEGNGVAKLFSYFDALNWMRHVFPSLKAGGPGNWLLAGVWACVFAALNVFMIKRKPDRTTE